MAIGVVEVVQVAVLWGLALALGWHPAVHVLGVVVAIVLGTVACAGLGLCLAGSLKALVTLAAANGLYLVLLLLSGMVIPLAKLPGAVRAVARALPSGALAEAVRGSLSGAGHVSGHAWLVLAIWAVAAPVAATRLFRWE
jgi:ABC-2 type transport system permease protein